MVVTSVGGLADYQTWPGRHTALLEGLNVIALNTTDGSGARCAIRRATSARHAGERVAARRQCRCHRMWRVNVFRDRPLDSVHDAFAQLRTPYIARRYYGPPKSCRAESDYIESTQTY